MTEPGVRCLPLLLAATLAGCGFGGDGRHDAARATATPTQAVLGAQASGDSPLEIGATSLLDLAQGRALSVRVDPPRGARSVLATLADRGGPPVPLSVPVALRGRRKRALELPVRQLARRVAAGCEKAELSLTVRGRGSRTLATRTMQLRPLAPDCTRYFGPQAVWNQRIAPGAALDQQSVTLVPELVRQVEEGYAKHYPPVINTTSYSTPVYTVPADQPRVPVALTRGQDYGGSLRKVLAEGVPIPPDARPAAGGDAHLVIWQPATDTMWELWATKQVDGRWQAGWGGRMEQTSRSPGYFHDPSGIQPGATASSLPLLGGLITLRDLARGRIDHALAMAIPSTRKNVWSLPAQRTDGPARRPDAIPQGARFRLDPALDIHRLDLPPFTRLLAQAAQRYGIYVRDTSPVVTLYAEDPTPTGENPWATAILPSSPAVLREFPWHRLQLMPMELRSWGGEKIVR